MRTFSLIAATLCLLVASHANAGCLLGHCHRPVSAPGPRLDYAPYEYDPYIATIRVQWRDSSSWQVDLARSLPNCHGVSVGEVHGACQQDFIGHYSQCGCLDR